MALMILTPQSKNSSRTLERITFSGVPIFKTAGVNAGMPETTNDIFRVGKVLPFWE